MKDLKGNLDYTASVIYNAAVDEEKKWRKECSRHDIILIDQLLKQVRSLGYHYRYFADITNRNNTQKDLLDLLLKYIGRFEDDYFSAALILAVGKKGNKAATDTILTNYIKLSNDSKNKHSGFYDNALSRIKDNRYLTLYMEFLKVPEDAIRFPLTMLMLAKWQVKEAKPFFIKYLSADSIYHNKKVSDLVYISLEALSYYEDTDGIILQAIEDKINTSDNRDLLRATQRAIKRLRKRQGDGSPVSNDGANDNNP